MATVMTIKCPDCGKTLKVTVEEEAQSKVNIATRSERESGFAEIADVLRKGMGKDIFKLGDTFGLSLKDGTYVEFEIAAFSPYEENTLALVMKDCVLDDKPLAEEGAYCKDGWKNCSLREYLNGEFYDLLPDDFRAVIKKRTIKQKLGEDVIECEDNIWIPSATEVSHGAIADVDDVHFELYENEIDKVKSHEGDTWGWWLRSPSVSTSNRAYVITASGTTSGITASNSYGLAPACIIG